MEHFLLQLFIFLTAAAIAVPLAKKCGLGSVLGYLIAGIIIGPFCLSLIGDIEEVMHFTEFGVVMMLFLVGLELKPSLLWKMKTPILGMGGSQVVLTSILIGGIASMFLPWQQAVAVGLTVSLSSTAIVLQTLREKGLMNTSPGRSVFSVLLFQDLAVIPMLAVLPLLATLTLQDSGHHGSVFFDITTLPGYLRILVTLLAILFVFLLGKFASRPIFRTIAATRVREIFVAAALALVVGISLLMSAVGLSPALGTFLAGVVLADSEYRHELESDIEPFKGLLLGIFFISIGASLNFTLIGDKILLIAGLVTGLIAIKLFVLMITGMFFKMPKSERWLFGLALAQGGEFAFVLFQVSKVNGVLPAETIEPLISAVAISMFLAPLLFLLHEKVIAVRQGDAVPPKDADQISHKEHRVILAGFGRLGTDLGRFLISAGIKPVILDHDAANVDILRKFGFEVYYGDITRLDLLEAAGAAEAELIIITMGNIDKKRELIELIKKHYPHLKIAVNAKDRSATYELMDLGITTIRRETFGSALALGQDALKLLGTDPYEAYKLMRIFRKKDEDTLPELYSIHREDQANYISMYQQHNADLEKLMSMDLEEDMEELDRAWSGGNPSA
ncbi:monovalent cation:proton antiporter-2 (CPA2) family protein [Desulfosediminicola flagellatus]|uniref:monovalent cation:proton antiporter-2 (CPA2) family protein n=1 Tax=Desulfosediminicola flagellatus TaxID=2569541 RepID=UPI0010ABBE80|nr:monovalent cation:proton antiporter-2 (CPA2) family protein [Desulfosediminicola flagellatus]